MPRQQKAGNKGNSKMGPAHSKLRGEPKKVLEPRWIGLLPNNLHIPNKLGLNSILIGMALKTHYFLLYRLGLKAQTSSLDKWALRLVRISFCEAYTAWNAVTSPQALQV